MQRDPDNMFWWLLMLFPLLAAILVACGAVHAQTIRTYSSGIVVSVADRTLTIAPQFAVPTPANTITFSIPDTVTLPLPDGSVTIPNLDRGVRDVLNNAVQIDSIDTENGGITIVFADDDGDTARVNMPIARWAREGNTDSIPESKLPTIHQVPQGGSPGQVLTWMATSTPHWANVPGVASSSPISTATIIGDLQSYTGPAWLPRSAVVGIPPTNAEANVQADWAEADTGSDAYILNKPRVLSEAEVEAEAQHEVTTSARRLTSTSIADTDSLVVSDASVASGEPRRLWAITDLDTRITTLARAAGIGLSSIEEFAKVGTDDRVPESRLPVELEGIQDEWARVGWIDDGGIYQHIGASNAGSSTPAAIVAYTYSKNAQHGVALNNVPIAIRVARERPVSNLRIIVDDGETSTSIPNTPWGQMVAHELGTPWPGSSWGAKVASDSNYDYYEITFTHTPPG